MKTLAVRQAKFQVVNDWVQAIDTAMRIPLQKIQADLIGSATQTQGEKRLIPQSAARGLIVRAGDTLERFYVGADFRHAFGSDGVTPLSPYAEALNKALALATWHAVEPHARLMQERLPEDLQRWLMTAQEATNPLANYNAPHTWIQGGYSLSDRIWKSGFEARAKLDAYLTDSIRAGTSALDMAQELEQFLLPSGDGLKVTNKPYGTKANYAGMRLGRTEISAAHTQASLAAAWANPFVDMVDIARSKSGDPTCPICPQFATIGINGERLREPYRLNEVETPPYHGHCMCTPIPIVTASTDDVVTQLRDAFNLGQRPPLTPVNTMTFVRRLLGSYLASLLFREVFK
jgi:hypothetical protein